MKTLRPIAVLLVTALTIQFGAALALAQNENDGSGQIEGNLPSSRAGMITLQGLAGTNELTYGALPQIGFEAVLENHYWHEDFYRVNAFMPYNLTPGTDYFFTNLAGGVTATGQGVANLGLGYGYYMEGYDRLLRSSVWIDVDDEHSNTYYAAGIHLENLGKFIDFRVDAGVVLTDTTRTVFNGLTGGNQFSGNGLFFNGRRITDTAFNHAQFETGGPLALLGDYGISAYAKGYYLGNSDADRSTLGVGFRGEWAITEDATFNFNYTHDDEFDDSTWFSIAVTTPDGAPRNIARPITVRERFSKPFIRNGRVPVKNEAFDTQTAAINPKTGTPYVFAHLNPNNNFAGGNGTFEAPFSSIDQLIAANNAQGVFDAIYVRPRIDGTSTNLTVQDQAGLVPPALTPLVLYNNQLLLGSTIDQTIDIGAGLTPTNTATITARDPGLAAPVLMNGTNNPSAIVYAANGNLISGFTFDGSANLHDGIRTDGNSIIGDGIDDGINTDLHVRNNSFFDTNRGIFAPDVSDGIPSPLCTLLGHSTIWNNEFIGNTTAYDVMINAANNDGAGGADTIDGTVLTLSILGNTIASNTNGGRVTANGVDAFLPPGMNQASIDLIGDEDQNGDGVLQANEDLDGNGVLTQRDLNGDGIPDNVIAGNIVTDNTTFGMGFFATNGGLIGLQVGAAPTFVQSPAMPMTFNTFSGNGDAGLRISATSSDVNGVPSAIGGTIIANNFSNPAAGGDSLELLATGAPMTLAYIDFGATAGSASAPILSAVNAPLGAYSGIIDQNIFDRTTSGSRGTVINLLNASGDFNFTRNSFTGTGNAGVGQGIDADIFGTAAPNGNPTAQLLMTVGGPTAAQGNLFDGNGVAAIDFRGGGFIGNPLNPLDRSFLQITNNSIMNTAGDGVLLRRDDAALYTAVIGDGIANNGNGNLISGNTGAGIHYLSANGSDQSLAPGFRAPLVYFDDNMIDSNGDGFRADLFADSTVQVFGVTNMITNTTTTAIDINTNNNSSFGLARQPTFGEDTNGDGVLQAWEDLNFDGILQVAGPTVLSSVFDSNFIQNFGVDGIWMTATGGSFQDIRISGTQLSNPLVPNSFIRTTIDGGGGTATDGVHIDSTGSQSVFASRASVWTVQGTDITGFNNDGIFVNSASGTNIYNFGGAAMGQDVRIDGGLASTDGLGINAGGAATDTFNIDNFMSLNNGEDGADIVQTGVNTLFFNMTRSTFNGNVEAGFSADNRSIAGSVYNIGTEERGVPDGVLTPPTNEDINNDGLLTAGEDLNGNGILDSGEDVNNNGVLNSAGVGNEFNNNGHQGFFFQTLNPLTGDNNIAGFFDSPDALIPPFPAGTAPQNQQGVNDNGDNFYTRLDPTTGQIINELGLYSSPGSTQVNVFSRLNFYGNQVLSNGAPATQADGMVLSVGTNTQLAATVDGNLFGGNALNDFHIITVVSQDPQASVANGGGTNIDRIRYDPVAFLDLAFGENFAFNPPRGFGLDAPTGPGVGNTGESIFIETIGHNTSVVGRTEVGVFGNSDIVKPEGRNAIGVYAIYTTGGSGDLNGTNVFSQQPLVSALFTGASVNIPGAPSRTTTAGLVIDPSPGLPFPYINATGSYNTINFINTAFP